MTDKKKRARTIAQKQQRHAMIIDAAEALLRQSGSDALTMEALAQAAGLAKGTTYLYFTSREALLLAVYNRLFDRWIDEFAGAMPERGDQKKLCEDFAACFARDPLFIQLSAISHSSLDPQLSVADFISAKRAMARRVKRLAGIVCARLTIDAVAGQRLVWRLLTGALGAVQMTAKPHCYSGELPADVRAFVDLADFKTVFMNAMMPIN